MPNLKCITLSAYKFITYIYLDIKSSKTQTTNICTCTCMHTHTHTHTHAHAHTQAPQDRRTEKKVFEKRKVFNEDLKELTGHIHTHAHTRTRTHTHTHTHTCTLKHTQAPQGRTEENVFEKRTVFNEDLKELTDDAWRGVCSMLLELGTRKSAAHLSA